MSFKPGRGSYDCGTGHSHRSSSWNQGLLNSILILSLSLWWGDLIALVVMAHLRWLTWTMATTRCVSPPPLQAPIASTYSSLPGRLRWILLLLWWIIVAFLFPIFDQLYHYLYRLLISRAHSSSRLLRTTRRSFPLARPARARPDSCRFANTKMLTLKNPLFGALGTFSWEEKNAFFWILTK